MMNRYMLRTAVLSTLVLSSLQPAFADSLKCGVYLIQEGERRPSGKYEVLKKCGEPASRQGNSWVYDRGGTAKIVTFNDSGQVASIRKY